MEKKESKIYMKKKEKKQSIFNEGRLIKKTCDHKVEDSLSIEVLDNEKLTVRCKLCGDKFSIKPKSLNDVHNLCREMLDIINCIKLKGEYGNSSFLPFETRKQLATTQMLLESLPDFYKDYYLDNLEGDKYESNRSGFDSNGPCEISSQGGLLLGNSSNWKKQHKNKDIEDLLGGRDNRNNGKKHHKKDRDDRDDRHHGNKKNKKRDDWGY